MKTLTKLSSTALVGGFVLALSTGAVLAKHHGMKGDMQQHGEKMFEMMDADNDGKVTREEMQAHRDARKAEADTNGDGKVSMEEFKVQARKKHEAHMDRMFSRMDQNGDGYLTDEDREGRPERGAKMFDRMDKDGDGALTREEMQSMRKHHGMKDGGMRGDGPRDGSCNQ